MCCVPYQIPCYINPKREHTARSSLWNGHSESWNTTTYDNKIIWHSQIENRMEKDNKFLCVNILLSSFICLLCSTSIYVQAIKVNHSKTKSWSTGPVHTQLFGVLPGVRWRLRISCFPRNRYFLLLILATGLFQIHS